MHPDSCTHARSVLLMYVLLKILKHNLEISYK